MFKTSSDTLIPAISMRIKIVYTISKVNCYKIPNSGNFCTL